MSRKKPRVRYELDSGDIKSLTIEEIKVILRAADELIATGGRSMLAKILKGSKDKKVLEHGLDQCPVYGYYREQTLHEKSPAFTYNIYNNSLFLIDSGMPLVGMNMASWNFNGVSRNNIIVVSMTIIPCGTSRYLVKVTC